MSLERDIQEALMKHADDVKPNAMAFDDVETKVGRAHRRRLTAITTAGIAMLAAVAIVLPQLNKDETTPGRFTTDPPTVGPTAPGPADGDATYRNENVGMQLRYPEDWRVGGFEGSIEFTPPGLPGLAVGEDTFVVEFQHRIGERYDEPEAGGPPFEPGTQVGGRDSVKAETIGKDGRRDLVYRVAWTAAACPKGVVCDAEIATLRILIHGSTAELYDNNADLAIQMVSSLATTQDAEWPAGAVTTPRGEVQSGVAYDELTGFLVRFLDARAEGGGAGPFLSVNAKGQYAAREGEFGLYAYGDPGQPWSSYSIEQRADADANSAEFVVKMFTTKQNGDKVTLSETIGVGAGGRGGDEIRFSNVEGFEGGI